MEWIPVPERKTSSAWGFFVCQCLRCSQISFLRVLLRCSLIEPLLEKNAFPPPPRSEEEEEEEEEDLFVFNDTIEGPRAPAVKPGCVTQA
jgi:hypothetical protein